MSTYPSFTPHKYLKKIAELKIVVDIKTIKVQGLYLISKQEGASGKKTRNKHSLGCIYKAFFLPLQPNYAKRSYFKFQTHLEFS